DLIRNSDDEDTKRRAADSLEEIGNGNEYAIQALVDLIRNSDDKYTKISAAYSLGEIGNGNKDAIQALVDLIRNSDDEDTKRRAAGSLDKITEIEQMTMVITNLQKYLPKDVYERSYYSFDYGIYQLFWNFAQNLSYPKFYAAWQQKMEN
ncbi:HEAT repeat domain-containing protein, partial [Sphaerospermopsis reniformis]|uniref:HEAT repeat domain-containing protein n=1 Tax=Sphaerospermopsis reniformis TaxID=531300 RepID=UPI0010F99C2D